MGTEMTVQLSEESTHEDIESAVDEIFSEVDAERAAEEEAAKDEEKTDSQITAEHSVNEDEDTTADSGSEKTGTEEEADSDWLTDDLRAEAAAVGIDKKDLEDFASREELDRALRILNRQIDAEREKGDESEKPTGSETETDGKDDTSKYEIKLTKDVYDEEIVGEFTRMRDHYDARLAELEQRFEKRFVDAETVAAEERFDRGVDALEFSQVFGKTGEESQAEMARRKELFERVQIEQEVLERMGRNVSDFNALVQRVARATFPEEYEKRTIKNHTRKVSRQSEKRQGGGATRPTDPPEDPRDEADRLYKELAGV